jgi:hypothetical protein
VQFAQLERGPDLVEFDPAIILQMGKWAIQLQYLPISSSEHVLFRFRLPDIVVESARSSTLLGLAIAGEVELQSSTAVDLSVTGRTTCLHFIDEDG